MQDCAGHLSHSVLYVLSPKLDIRGMNSRDREFWTEFLLLYRSLPAVWQIHSTEYSSRALKSAGYDRLIRKLREVEPLANRSLVVRKINSFRTNFRRDIRRRDSCSAAGESFQSTLWYFDLLGFLEGQDEKSSTPKADCRTNRHVTSSPEPSAYVSKYRDNKFKLYYIIISIYHYYQ